MPSKWTSRKAVRLHAKKAFDYSQKVLYQLMEIQKMYEGVEHPNQTYLQAAIEMNILNRDMLLKLRENL